MEDYTKALKSAKKCYQRNVAKGEYPYLPAMEDVIAQKGQGTLKEDSLGLVHIPAHLIVGTAYAGRTNSFASNFMPLLDADTEFAKKWAYLCRAHVEEGIREPIKVFEYMNKFYVVEGNKRVSVLKYFDAGSVPAMVTRKIPEKSNDTDVIIYYEFMEFYELTRIYRIIFSKQGSYQKLLELLPVEKDVKWDDEFRQDFLSAYYRFETAYEKSKVKNVDLTAADVFLVLLEEFGYAAIEDLSSDEMLSRIEAANDEILLEEVHDIKLEMEPEEAKKNIFDWMFPSSIGHLKVAFVNNKAVEQSGWVYGHELGRLHLENEFKGKVSTARFEINTKSEIDSVDAIEEMAASLEEIIYEGYKVIFTTTPELVEPALKVSLAHPEVIILNCSLNVPHKYVRTYYGRMYEAKFIMGAIAAAYSESDNIGYVADYPIYGMTANINAFALGASMINPRAKVYLKWETLKEQLPEDYFEKLGITMVSYRDMLAPNNKSAHFGLCYHDNEKDMVVNLAMPIWNWGEFYEKIVKSIFDGDYKKNADVALNYWWGMSADAIDIFCSHHLPIETRRLADFMKSAIKSEVIKPFCGKIVAQDGTVYSEIDTCMMPEDLMKMEWLVKNVVGEIPTIDELKDEVKPIVRLQGVLGVVS